jgi:hypothetical protein
VENFIIVGVKYWDFDPTDEQMRFSGSGRKAILDQMLQMRQGDIVFIPNLRMGGRDERYFASAVVGEAYRFEDRSNMPDGWERDFGHIIGVTQVESHGYSPNTLVRTDFQAYRRAIDQIRPNHQGYNTFIDFIRDRTSAA